MKIHLEDFWRKCRDKVIGERPVVLLHWRRELRRVPEPALYVSPQARVVFNGPRPVKESI